ncbi:hypothetical protein Hanom_Chr16g01449161 [Helianthus anomalus]
MKRGAIMVLGFLFLLFNVSPSSASDDRRQKWWKWPSSAGNSICSSVVLPLYGNVYPQG